MPNRPGDRLTCTLQRACELTGVSRRTLYNWLKAGKVEFIRTAAGGRRVFLDSLFRAGNVPVDLARIRPAAPLAPFPIGPLVPPALRSKLYTPGRSATKGVGVGA